MEENSNEPRLIYDVSDIEEMTPEVLEFLNDFYNLTEEQKLYASDIEVTSTDINSPIMVKPRSEEIIISKDELKKDNFNHSYGALGEELGHILYENTGYGIFDELPVDNFNEGLNDFDTYEFLRTFTVHEFVGRLSAIQSATEFGGPLSDLPQIPKINTNLELENLDGNYLDPFQGVTTNNTPPVFREAMDALAHHAGYRAAEEQIIDASNDEKIIEKGPEQIYKEYNLQDRLNEVFGEYLGT